MVTVERNSQKFVTDYTPYDNSLYAVDEAKKILSYISCKAQSARLFLVKYPKIFDTSQKPRIFDVKTLGFSN